MLRTDDQHCVGEAYGYSDASRADSNRVFSSGWNRGCHRTLCICGHRKGRPKPGTVQPICLRVAIVRLRGVLVTTIETMDLDFYNNENDLEFYESDCIKKTG